MFFLHTILFVVSSLIITSCGAVTTRSGITYLENSVRTISQLYTLPESGLTLSQGMLLRLEPGAIIKGDGALLNCNGGYIEFGGTEAGKIIFEDIELERFCFVVTNPNVTVYLKNVIINVIFSCNMSACSWVIDGDTLIERSVYAPIHKTLCLYFYKDSSITINPGKSLGIGNVTCVFDAVQNPIWPKTRSSSIFLNDNTIVRS